MIRTETDIQECRKLWVLFAPQQGPWDDWGLMFAFHDQDNHRFNFLVHETGDGPPDGIVPLVEDTKQKRFVLMAGSYPDGRILRLRNQDFPELFEQFPERTVLFDLKQSWVSDLLKLYPQFEANFSEQDLRYYLVPSEFKFDFHKRLDTFSADKKQKFLYDPRKPPAPWPVTSG